MAKGNSKAYLNSPFVDNTEIDIQENALLVSMAKDVFNMKEPDLYNPDEVANTINEYFNTCMSKGLRPGNMGLYTSLGLTKSEVFNLVNGNIKSVNGKTVNPASIEHIKKACKALSLFRETLGSHGKLNPVTLLFWQKNYDGLTDVKQIEIDTNSAPKADLSPQEIEQKLLEDMPIDSTMKEL